MKYILYLILLITITACVSQKNVLKEKKKTIKKLVFNHFFYVTKDGVDSWDIIQDSLVGIIREEETNDSLPNKPFDLEFSMAEAFRNTPPTEVHIELMQDTIWRHITERGKVIGDLQRIDKESGIVYYHAKINPTIMYKEVSLFDIQSNYTIEEDRGNRKVILGFDCYKVILKKEEKDLPYKVSPTVYEMYVTEEIDLPLHVLLNTNRLFSDFFPLQVIVKNDALKGNEEIYHIKEIM